MNAFINSVFLARQVAPEPNVIIRPIAALFGHVVNFLFNIVYAINPANSLGFAIILMTIIFSTCMLPMMLKSQKSMMKMRDLKPELDKLEAKYSNTKDPELLKKKRAEQSALMAKHDANPIKGCFPMLLTMPLFMGVNFIMNQAFLYITRLRDVYHELAVAIQQVPGYVEMLTPTALDLLPNRLHRNADEVRSLMAQGVSFEAARAQVGDVISLEVPADLARVINRFTAETWYYLQNQIPEYYWSAIAVLNEQRQAMETFFGLNMVEPGGWTWPVVLIPILVGLTMAFSMYVGGLRNADQKADDKVRMQQRIMTVGMPIFIAFITVGLPMGVGLFWITRQVYQLVQDLVINKKAGVPFKLPFVKSKAS